VIKLPFGVNINNLIDDLRIVSWEASEILLSYRKIIKKKDHLSRIIKIKKNDDPVTLADLKVNELIINRLKKKYKNISWEILSEENVKLNSYGCDRNADWLWILDPLDGTKDFIQGTGNYAMHLGLNYEQKPFIGVVLIPERGELWITDGVQIWCEKKDGSRKEYRTFNNKVLKEMTLVTSKNHRNDNLKKLINRIDLQEVVVMGSIGCKIASIIRGESDIYISMSLPNQSSPKDWDFAAPEALLKAAGGSITNLDNQELVYNKPSFEQSGIIIATSDKNTHPKICLEIKNVLRKFNIHS
tara:strand:+ start:8576 stop:9475 length:900 start_codon:yes stop_codon:yes gene_type:complete